MRHEMQKLDVLRSLSKNIKGALVLFSPINKPTARDVIRVLSKNVKYSPSYKSRHPIEKQHLQWFKTFVGKLEGIKSEIVWQYLLYVIAYLFYYCRKTQIKRTQ